MGHFIKNNGDGANSTATAAPTATPKNSPSPITVETKVEIRKKPPFYKTWWGILLQVILPFISIPCWIVYWAKKGITEGLLDYLFMKVERDEEGRITKVKFISIPEFVVCGMLFITTPWIFACIQHFFPDASIACAFLSFAMMPLLFIVALYDLPTIKFIIIGLIVAIASPFISIGWSNLFGPEWEIFHNLNRFICWFDLHLTTKDYIFESLLWFAFVFPFALVALFQKRYELANNEAYEVKIGKRTSIATWTDRITIDASATGEWLLGLGKLVFKKGDGTIEIPNVPGLGLPTFRILYPWLMFKSSPRKTIEGLAERGDELHIG